MAVLREGTTYFYTISKVFSDESSNISRYMKHPRKITFGISRLFIGLHVKVVSTPVTCTSHPENSLQRWHLWKLSFLVYFRIFENNLSTHIKSWPCEVNTENCECMAPHISELRVYFGVLLKIDRKSTPNFDSYNFENYMKKKVLNACYYVLGSQIVG